MSNFKRKSKYIFATILLISISVLTTFFGIKQFIVVEAEVSVSKEISENYAFGDEFIAPDCTFTVGSNSVKGEHSLRFPDGTHKKDAEITLNQSGKYLLKYLATIQDKVYTKEYVFSVDSKLATYSNEKTSIEYGLCTSFGANTSGLNVKIANGDSLTFGHVFDMTELTSATKIVEGFVVPEVQGKADFARMVFTFTDVIDPSVQLVYYGNFHNDINSYGLTFFTAAGNGQVQTGLEYVGKLHTGSTLGCLVPHSFMAVDTGLYYGAYAGSDQPVKNCPPDAKKFCISYDYKQNQAWAGGKIISDLDDNNYYSTLWFGFPSGKAKLTVSALNYNGAFANMCLTSILGVDLTAENFVDDNPPSITIDNHYEQMPLAIVGGTYPVPVASAIDEENGECEVQASVWYEYTTSTRKMVDIKNGRFKVDKVGTYAIVYKATDFSGNVATEILWVKAVLAQPNQKLKVDVDKNYNTQIEVGTVQRLPNVNVVGGSGDNFVTFVLSNGTEKFTVENGEFILEKTGEWTLTCTATDYVGSIAVTTVKLNCVTSGKPVIIDKPILPAAYISGGRYTLPLLKAYEYSSGSKIEKICSVEITCEDKKTTVESGKEFTPTVTTSGNEVQLSYVCEGVTLYQTSVPVIIVFDKEEIGNTGNFRQVICAEKYFFTKDNISIVNGEELNGNKGIKFTALENLDSAKLEFINPQLANAFSLNFFTVPNCSKFEGITFTIRDSLDKDVAIEVTLLKDDGQTKLIVGDTQISLLMDFDGAVSTSYSLGFENNKIVINSTTSISVKHTINESEFKGFPSGKVYFEIKMINPEEGATLFLTEISKVKVANNQDNTAPYVTTIDAIDRNAFKDSVYTIPKVIACDVLCPNVVSYLTVKNPDGSIAISQDGVRLERVDATVDYELFMSTYGTYSVLVETKEENWRYSNTSYFEYSIVVVDGEAPTITFEGKWKENIRVGGKLTIPKYEVKDGHSSKDKITVITVITNPKGMPIYLYGEERSIICEYAGQYKICIFVYDEAGNLTVFEKTINVK